ncbi:hypothetical protein NL676_013083 [Syzygium grande]|nr:hypothetical protein NL676_013083 [Syzygium grande]
MQLDYVATPNSPTKDKFSVSKKIMNEKLSISDWARITCLRLRSLWKIFTLQPLPLSVEKRRQAPCLKSDLTRCDLCDQR